MRPGSQTGAEQETGRPVPSPSVRASSGERTMGNSSPTREKVSEDCADECLSSGTIGAGVWAYVRCIECELRVEQNRRLLAVRAC